MKKLLAMILVISMLLVLAACGGEEKPGPTPGPTPGTDTPSSGNAGGDTTVNNDKPDEPDEYQPDLDAKYGGMVGIGTETGVAYFDNIKLVSKQSNKMVLIDNKLEEGNLPEFTNHVSVGGNWDKDAADISIVVDPSEEYKEDTAEEKKNHVIAVNTDGTGVLAAMGEAQWNYYQYMAKVLPADENTVINLYFCMKDENNYFVLSLGENGNTQVDCYQVKDGVKETAAFKIKASLSLEEFTPIGITVDREIIDIYIDGALKLSLFNPDFENQYYEYKGEVEPSSITESGYGAPGAELVYFPVAPENVMHDGKGTWGNNLSNLATNVFDMNIATFYDCDEKEESETTPDELVGIAGDGTFATSYVGAYFENGIKLTHIRYAPRADQTSRLQGAILQVSEDGVTWTDLYTIDTAPTANDYATAKVSDGETAYKYIRLVGKTEGYGNIAELEFWGIAG